MRTSSEKSQVSNPKADKLKKPFLYGFVIQRPKYFLKQESILSWLAEAHAKSERSHVPPLRATSSGGGFDGTAALKIRDASTYMSMFMRFGCSPEQIQYRGLEVEDYMHSNWDEMKVMRFDKKLQGEGFTERMKIYSKSAERVVTQFYADDQDGPDQIIHVSCTGYESPSAVQKVISKKQWGKETSSVHAYHMGCYAAFPAMSMAANRLARTGGEKQVDLVHTEMCTLHLDASSHTAEQLVIQSLFADGFIRYSMVNEDAEPARGKTGLVVEGFLERMVDDSAHAMTWVCSDFGLQMTLDKDVPGLIAKDIDQFCIDLAKQCGHQFPDLHKNAIFAIHPGGPKIIASIQKLLKLEDHQVQHSRDALKKYGNMSSATVPHILTAIIEDKNIPDGTPVVSMAFGPGLTMFGAVFVKGTK